MHSAAILPVTPPPGGRPLAAVEGGCGAEIGDGAHAVRSARGGVAQARLATVEQEVELDAAVSRCEGIRAGFLDLGLLPVDEDRVSSAGREDAGRAGSAELRNRGTGATGDQGGNDGANEPFYQVLTFEL